MSLAKRLNKIEPFHVMDLLAKAKGLQASGHDVLHLEVGEPDFATPAGIIDAAKNALDDHKTFYTGATGIESLRKKIAQFYLERYQVSVDWQRIIITPGASSALQLALALVVDEQQDVLISEPGYPCNRHFIELLSANPKLIPMDNELGIDFDRLVQNDEQNLAATLVASPANPTGKLLTKEQLEKLLQLNKACNAQLIVDEIYHGLVYDQDRATSILELTNQAIVVNSFSKYFNMTGFRLGWLVVPEELITSADKLAQNLFLCAPTVSQYAALAAFEPKQIEIFESRKLAFKQRRDFLCDALVNMGFELLAKPEGAFYLYVDASKFTLDSFAFCHQLLDKQYLALTPGLDFGGPCAKTAIRLAYTCDIDKLKQAMTRLKNFLESNQNEV